MNITQAIARVRRLIDDRDQNPLVSDEDIRESLRVAAEEVWQMCITSGATIYSMTQEFISDKNGVVDLQAVLPLTISGVSVPSGTRTLPVPAARPGDSFCALASPQAVRVSYVPRVQQPLADGLPYVWSTEVIPSNTLDQLLCVTAALDCWITTGEPSLKSLVTRKEELVTSIKEIPSIPQHTVIAVGSRSARAPFSWTRGATPNTIQLVY